MSRLFVLSRTLRNNVVSEEYREQSVLFCALVTKNTISRCSTLGRTRPEPRTPLSLKKSFSLIALLWNKKRHISEVIQISQTPPTHFSSRSECFQSKKSEVAAHAVKGFNADVRIESLMERVGEDTEHIFNDDFFEQLNGIANALDNVQAREL